MLEVYKEYFVPIKLIISPVIVAGLITGTVSGVLAGTWIVITGFSFAALAYYDRGK